MFRCCVVYHSNFCSNFSGLVLSFSCDTPIMSLSNSPVYNKDLKNEPKESQAPIVESL